MDPKGSKRRLFRAAAGSPECFRKLMGLYEFGFVPPMELPGPYGPRVLQMGFRDGMVLKSRYPDRSRYLGAQQVGSKPKNAVLTGV